MLKIAIGLFVAAAVLGIIILRAIIQQSETPKVAVFIHGLLAAAGLGLVTYYVITNPDNNPLVSLIILAIGAVGGFYLLARDLKKKPGPIGLAIIHMLAGLTGVILLLMFVI
ncbi:MAG TPA: hypothetical protein VJT83_09560 [Chitinophagaceae bacterium]|nr:hypothetical protein [Chitinophagaceae bacterium]